MTSSKPNHLPKAAHPNTITSGVRTSTYAFRAGNTNATLVDFKLGYLEMSQRPLRAMSERSTGWAPEPSLNLFYCVSFYVSSSLGKNQKTELQKKVGKPLRYSV